MIAASLANLPAIVRCASRAAEDRCAPGFESSRHSSLHHAQGVWLQGLQCLESVRLLTGAGYLAFNLSGLPAGVHSVHLAAPELHGSIPADHQLHMLQLDSDRALEIYVEPPEVRAAAKRSSADTQVLSAAFVPRCPALSACTGIGLSAVPRPSPVLNSVRSCLAAALGARHHSIAVRLHC